MEVTSFILVYLNTDFYSGDKNKCQICQMSVLLSRPVFCKRHIEIVKKQNPENRQNKVWKIEETLFELSQNSTIAKLVCIFSFKMVSVAKNA